VERVVVESFNHDSILEIKRIDSSIRTAALFQPRLARPFPSMRRMIARATASLSARAPSAWTGVSHVLRAIWRTN
ncbi:MAG TPA: hypothetical protein VE842_10315, partial [Pyrinomonadaceae bacterium]|nr:hypothetical protein [Pyrinomonadaceae bacterium]